MKATILDFLRRTQKATASLLSALGVFASATFIPEPFSYWLGVAAVVVSWVSVYLVPYVAKVVEHFPLVELLEPETVELEAIEPATVGIPVVEGADSGARPYPGPTVEEILRRLRTESEARPGSPF